MNNRLRDKKSNYFFNKLAYIVLIFFVGFLLSACGMVKNKNSSIDDKQNFDTVIINADHSQIDYPVNIYLPREYKSNSDKRYPVLYVLDAEWYFSLVVNEVIQKNKSMIVVGVGNTDSEIRGRRIVDYRMPGALAYYNFLTQQVIPLVDSNYLTNTSNRGLMGYRLGGLFSGLAILLEDPNNRYFSRYISQDGSFLDQPLIVDDLESQLFAVTNNLPAQIIITGSTLDDGNGRYAEQFYNLLNDRNYKSIDLKYWPYSTDSNKGFLLSIGDVLENFY